IPLKSAASVVELTSEDQARKARYRILFDTAHRIGTDRIVTAHHADDQAETVLFRILRGTGLHGLGGIPASTASGVIRPMLSFWRAEIEQYAIENGITARMDPTNETFAPVRNRLRLNFIPALEREISTHARRNLVALSKLARESEAGWRSIVDEAFARSIAIDGGSLLVAREPLRQYHPAVASRIIRKALRRFGIVPDRAGTG